MTELFSNIYIENVRLNLGTFSNISIIVIKGDDRSLLIDAGIHESITGVYRDALLRVLEELQISFGKLDCFVTHVHSDHVGLCRWLSARGVKIFMNPEEKDHMDDMLYYCAHSAELRESCMERVGFDRQKEPEIFEKACSYAVAHYGTFFGFTDFIYSPVSEGDVFTYGNISLEAVPLPGHTYGQIGLIDKKRRLMFCGDQIIHGITPVVGSWSGTVDNLSYFLKSLSALSVKYADMTYIPGHGEIIRDVRKEIAVIRRSYDIKLFQVQRVLSAAQKPLCVRDIARIVYGKRVSEFSLENFPTVMLTWYKVYACLIYLKNLGLAEESMEGNISMWRTGNKG